SQRRSVLAGRVPGPRRSEPPPPRDHGTVYWLQVTALPRMLQLLAVVRDVGPVEGHGRSRAVRRHGLVADPHLAQIADLRHEIPGAIVAGDAETRERGCVLALPGALVARQPVAHLGLGQRASGRGRGGAPGGDRGGRRGPPR